MNNNILKQRLITKAMEIGNLVSFKELELDNLNSSSFEIVLISNKTVLHKLVFNYHCKLLSYSFEGDISKLTKFNRVELLLAEAKAIRKEIGYMD